MVDGARRVGRSLVAVALVLAALGSASPAAAHPEPSAGGAGARPARPSLIPPEDQARYRSEVTALTPPIPGLEARIVGGQEKLEVTWTGPEPLVVEGTDGEPMLRLTQAEVEVNERSPSAWSSSERFGRVELPADVDPDARPRWRSLGPGGRFSWYEHRAQWMRAARPAEVTDPASPTTISDWSVPIRVGDQSASIGGTLRWVPDPSAIREKRSEVSSPLLSALILIAAMAVGALIGLRLRPRLAAAGLAPGSS